MQQADTSGSVGIVSPKTLYSAKPVTLANGRVLPEVTLVYETYGTLNEHHSNAVLICHALSGNHHAAGYHHPDDTKPGWWDNYIGPGKPIDTNRFFVVCMNNIGGCDGSTGPTSINPETGKPYGPDFPMVRVRDWVSTQHLLMEALEIPSWAAVIGGSLGGMQAMRWCVDFPDKIRNCVVIASATKLTAQNIAFNEIARSAITSDPDFHDGRYLEHGTSPRNGLAIARMIGHVTYLSGTAMGMKFGRDLRSGTFEVGTDKQVEFQVESYLRYQGESFSGRFDANTYILMTKALDYFDLARDFNDDASKALAATNSHFLIVSFTSDWRFSPDRSKEIVDALVRANKSVSYAEVEADNGHDAFLISIERYQTLFAAYMNRITI
ncbi:MAG: homoserine O-acetyltransferase [Pseudomonadales bacterium]|nr:homoserine O-acetyltransferase [Pseudomonadales bacterium]